MEQNSKRVWLLLISAFIWGTAFVAQLQGGDATGPYTFVFIRSLIGGTILLPFIILFDKIGVTENKPVTKEDWKRHIIGGVIIGVFIALTSIFQQVGMYMGASAGKSGFLTACYVVMVPILGLFFHRRCSMPTWVAVFMAMIGLYLLCVKGGFSIETCDLVVLLAALACAFQILTIDRYTSVVDAVRLSCIEFYTGAVVAFFPTLFLEMRVFDGGLGEWALRLTTWNAWLPLLYAGLLSNGVAYTLQVVAQKGANPAVASVLMSLESVFSVLAGAVLLGERLSLREAVGCIIIFAAVLLAQLGDLTYNKNKGEE